MIPFDSDKKEKTLPPAGAHVATLYSIVELGTMETEYNGEKKMQRKIRLTWELPEELRDFDGEEKPMVVGKKFTASLFEQSKLRPIVVGMLGSLSEEDEENFDIKSLLGRACMLQISHEEYNGTKYANVISCTQLPKSVKAPKQVNESVYFDYATFDQETYEKLPQWLQEAMAASQEMKQRNGQSDDIRPEDVPF